MPAVRMGPLIGMAMQAMLLMILATVAGFGVAGSPVPCTGWAPRSRSPTACTTRVFGRCDRPTG